MKSKLFNAGLLVIVTYSSTILCMERSVAKDFLSSIKRTRSFTSIHSLQQLAEYRYPYTPRLHQPNPIDKTELEFQINNYLVSLWILRRLNPKIFFSQWYRIGCLKGQEHIRLFQLKSKIVDYYKTKTRKDLDKSHYEGQMMRLSLEYDPEVLLHEFEVAKTSWDQFVHHHPNDEELKVLTYTYNPRKGYNDNIKHLLDRAILVEKMKLKLR